MTKTTDGAALQRASFTQATIVLGTTTNIRVDGSPMRRPNLPNGTGMHRFCNHPDHKGVPAETKQKNVCPDDHQLDNKECELGRTVEDEVVLIDNDDLAEARIGGMRKTGDGGSFVFKPRPTDQVEQSTRPDGTGHRLRLGEKANDADTRLFAALTVYVETHPEVSLLAECRIKDDRGLYRLESWRGQLFLQKLVHTADLSELNEAELAPDADEDMIEGVAALLDEQFAEYDPDEFFFDAAASIDRYVAKVASGEDDGVPVVADDASDPLAEIKAALNTTKKKAPAKKAAKKRKAPAKKAAAKRKTKTVAA